MKKTIFKSSRIKNHKILPPPPPPIFFDGVPLKGYLAS